MILIGREAVQIKWRRGCGGERGPRPKEKRRSLKLASQTSKKAVRPQRWKAERWRGRVVKRKMMGRRERSLKRPLGMEAEMK